jgi:hypothetical protein
MTIGVPVTNLSIFSRAQSADQTPMQRFEWTDIAAEITRRIGEGRWKVGVLQDAEAVTIKGNK